MSESSHSRSRATASFSPRNNASVAQSTACFFFAASDETSDAAPSRRDLRFLRDAPPCQDIRGFTRNFLPFRVFPPYAPNLRLTRVPDQVHKIRSSEDDVNSVVLALPRPRGRAHSGPLVAIAEQALSSATVSRK